MTRTEFLLVLPLTCEVLCYFRIIPKLKIKMLVRICVIILYLKSLTLCAASFPPSINKLNIDLLFYLRHHNPQLH